MMSALVRGGGFDSHHSHNDECAGARGWVRFPPLSAAVEGTTKMGCGAANKTTSKQVSKNNIPTSRTTLIIIITILLMLMLVLVYALRMLVLVH
jgi:hypothetical protein